MIFRKTPTIIIHCTSRCAVNGCEVSRLLIDNGSTINVYPFHVLTRLGYSKQNLGAYDNVKRDVLGLINLLIECGHVVRKIEFMVVEHKIVFSHLGIP